VPIYYTVLVYNQLSAIYENVDDSSWFRHCATSREVAESIPDGFIGIFHFSPGVDSASSRNEYQEYLRGGNGGRCVGLTTLLPSCADCLELTGASASWPALPFTWRRRTNSRRSTHFTTATNVTPSSAVGVDPISTTTTMSCQLG